MDVTDPDVYPALVADFVDDPETFPEVMRSERARRLTHHDFAIAQSWGVRGFPALLARHDRQLTLVAHGYAPLDRVLAQIEIWRAQTDEVALRRATEPSAAALLASSEGLPTLDDDTLARLERDQELDAEPTD